MPLRRAFLQWDCIARKARRELERDTKALARADKSTTKKLTQPSYIIQGTLEKQIDVTRRSTALGIAVWTAFY